jgi:hypothetical protein
MDAGGGFWFHDEEAGSSVPPPVPLRAIVEILMRARYEARAGAVAAAAPPAACLVQDRPNPKK